MVLAALFPRVSFFLVNLTALRPISIFSSHSALSSWAVSRGWKVAGKRYLLHLRTAYI
jgi:hypothetical protein